MSRPVTIWAVISARAGRVHELKLPPSRHQSRDPESLGSLDFLPSGRPSAQGGAITVDASVTKVNHCVISRGFSSVRGILEH